MDLNLDYQRCLKRKASPRKSSSPVEKVVKITNNLSSSLTPVTPSMEYTEDVQCKTKSTSGIDDEVELDYFAALPDELILMIFKNCSKPTLINCACVCRRWKDVAFDNDLWMRIDISQRKISPGNMIHVLSKNPIILRMAQTEVNTPIFKSLSAHVSMPNFNCKIRYLDLSMAVILPRDLEILLASCYSLKKLSLEHCELNENICKEISKNLKLTALNLSLCTGLNDAGLKWFLRSCQNLTELNIAWTSLNGTAIQTVCQFLSVDILKLNFSGGAKQMTDLHVSTLVVRCNKLRELDLSDATGITETSVEAICKNLKDLQVLSLSRCYTIYPPTYTKLFVLPLLSHLNIFGLFADLQIDQFRKMHKIFVNQMKFSFIARPTVGDHQTSIWFMPSR